MTWTTFCDISQIPGAGGGANMGVYGDLFVYPKTEEKGREEKDKSACIGILHSFLNILMKEVRHEIHFVNCFSKILTKNIPRKKISKNRGMENFWPKKLSEI